MDILGFKLPIKFKIKFRLKSQKPTIYDSFVGNVIFKNNRYEVQLPWKEMPPILPDNYELIVRG